MSMITNSAVVLATVSGDPRDSARCRVGSNAPAGFSGCATDDGYRRYRAREAGGTGGSLKSVE